MENPGFEGEKTESAEPQTNGSLAMTAWESGKKGDPEGAEAVAVSGDPYKGYRIGKQVVLVFTWICIGLAGEIVGPTLVDLKDRLGVNYEEVSRVLIGKSIGMLIGSIIGGFLNERFYKHVDLTMAGCLVLMAVSAVVTPFSRVLPLTGTMFALNGFAEGIINTGGNTMVMHLFGDDTASPMQSLHFGFGFGALLAPQLARPFLSPDSEDIDDILTTASMYTTPGSMNVTMAPLGDPSRIEIAYGIIGGLIFLFSIVLTGFYIKGPPKGFEMHKPTTNFKEMVSPGSCTGGFVCYGVQLLVSLFFYFIMAVGMERAIGRFLFSFAVESEVKMRKSEATNLQTAFWACFTAGRLLGVPIAKFVPVRFMILGDIVALIIISTILAIFAHYQILVLWICTCLLGPFIGVCFPDGMSWANMKLNMNSMAVMILMVGGSCGGFISQYLTGFLFQKETRNLMFVMVGFAALLLLVFISMEIIAGIQERKVKRRETENDVQLVHKS